MAAAPQSQASGKRAGLQLPAVAGLGARSRSQVGLCGGDRGSGAPGRRRKRGGGGGGETQAGISLVTIHEGGWERGRGWSKKKEWNQGDWG